MIDELGGTKTYNHYPNGWAMAFNTPFKMWKRYEFNGGTSDPCIISWPAGTKARGEIRAPVPPRDRHRPDDPRRPRRRGAGDDQGAHAVADRRRQHARELRRRLRRVEAEDAVLRDARLPLDLARGLEGGDDASVHRRLGQLQRRRVGALPRRRRPRRRCNNLAAEQPDKLRELVNIWFSEAGANGAFPLDDRTPVEILTDAPAAADRAPQPVRVLPGHGAGQRVAGRQHARTARS